MKNEKRGRKKLEDKDKREPVVVFVKKSNKDKAKKELSEVAKKFNQ